MKYFEFGKEHPERMGMLHGGGVCYRGALPVAEEMAKLAGEYPEQFSREVQATHQRSLEKEKR